MTYLIDELEAAKLVTRRPDPADRRARQVIITAKGTRSLEQAQQQLESAENGLLSVLDASEAALFRSMLERIARQAQVDDHAGPGCPAAADC